MTYHMKKILLLGACRPGHFALFELGYEVVWMMPKSKAMAVDLKNPYHSIIYYDDYASNENIIEMARPFHLQKPFNGICTYHDDVQQLAIAISNQLNIFYELDSELSELVHNKYKVRLKLKEAGQDSIEFCQADNTQQLREALQSMKLPVIAKPLSGTGSQGISIVHTPEQSEAVLERLLQCNSGFPIIVESYLQGREFSVEGISEGGQHRIIAITEKFIDHKTFVELGHVVPARLREDEYAKICTYVASVLDILGVSSGLTHTEVMLTSEGVQIIETHTRAGGDRIPLLVKYAMGIDLYTLYARQSAGDGVFDSLKVPVQPIQAAAVMFVCPDINENALLRKIDNIEEVEALEYVQEFKLMKDYGQAMGNLTGSFSRTAMVVVTGADADQALARAKDACSLLTVHCSWNQRSVS
jgi:biotin carboxylase